MGRLIILVALVAIVAWLVMSRTRGSSRPTKPPKPTQRRDEPSPMLACAHCGVHLPQAEAVVDAAGRAFCSEAHRLAGPRP